MIYMRPITERIEPNGPKELGIIDVALVPSHCLGRFIVNAGSHGERVVYKLPIIGMTQAEKEALEAGDSTPLKEHVEPYRVDPPLSLLPPRGLLPSRARLELGLSVGTGSLRASTQARALTSVSDISLSLFTAMPMLEVTNSSRRI